MANASETADEAESFSEGRYLYCAVAIGDSPREFEADGLDDEHAYLVTEGDVGAVVQPCGSVFDSGDPTTVKRWLLDHQRVVDAAGETFATPLPFRFDTILKGGDEAVREWLRREREALSGALESVAGKWEYRIELTTEEGAAAEELEASDERLRELAAAVDGASEGAAFLKEKQYEKRLREVRREREAARLADLESRLEDLAIEVHRPESSSPALGGRSAEGPRLTVLASAENEDAIGEVLESVAADPGVEVRFTGPWPPYSFAPSFGDGTNGGSRGSWNASDGESR